MDAVLVEGLNSGLRLSIDNVFTMLSSWNNDENIYGETDVQYKTTFQYLANVYSFLLAKSIIDGNVDIDTAFCKFQYFHVRKCFSCKGININDYLEAYHINVQDVDNTSDFGVETMEEESTLQVEGSNVSVTGTISTLNVISFVNGSRVCTNYLTDITCSFT